MELIVVLVIAFIDIVPLAVLSHKMIFAHSKCKRYENRKIQGVALPQKERIGQERKNSPHGTHHSEQSFIPAIFWGIVFWVSFFD